MILYIFIFLLNAVAACRKKNNNLISFFSFLYLGIVAGKTDLLYNSDTLPYYTDYSKLGSFGYQSRFEWLYVLFEKISVKFGIQYSTFRMVLLIMGFLIFFLGLRLIIKNVSFFYCLVSVTDFPFEATQIRSFIMFSLVILGIGLFKQGSKRSKILGLIVTFLSVGFHSSGYLFLVAYILLNLLKYKSNLKFQISKIAPILSLVFAIGLKASGLAHALGNLLSVMLGVFSENSTATERIAVRFNVIGSTKLTIGYALVFILFIYVIYNNRKINLDLEGHENFSFLLDLRLLISITCVGIPLMMISADYMRILREGMILSFIYWVMSFEVFNYKLKVKDLVYISMGLVCIIGFIFLFYFSGGNIDFTKGIPYLLRLGTNYS